MTVIALLFAALHGVPGATIHGTVRWAGSAPGRPLQIVIRDLGRRVAHGIETDRLGRFSLDGVAPGSYRVEVLGADSVPVSTRPVTVNGGTARLTIELPRAARLERPARSSDWLALLPEGETKRRFVLDCTGCHQFDEGHALNKGAVRGEEQWGKDITRMLGYAGPRSSFPVISSGADPVATGAWLAQALGSRTVAAVRPAPASDDRARAVISEYDMPVAQDLPHDVAIDAMGQVVITGMFSHAMFRLDPDAGTFRRIPIPVERANPRAVELDRDGIWWVLLGGPKQLGRYDPATGSWRFFEIGMYPHSIALGSDGKVWFNGHFTHDPELIGWVEPGTGAVATAALPPHPSLASDPGGPISYEQRVGPDGRVWVSELQGNRIVAYDPKTGTSRAYPLPLGWSGPRRFDVAADGTVWIPAYSGNQLLELDPRSGGFTAHQIPVPNGIPYVVRVDDRRGAVWIGLSAGDAILRYEPARNRFTTYPLPSVGAMIRHLAVEPRSGDVWMAYGASPGSIPARIARLRFRGAPSRAP